MSKIKGNKKGFKNILISFVFFMILGIIVYFVYPIVLEILHEHEFVEGKCECGETDPNYEAPHEHEFVEGKCECGEIDPNFRVLESDELSIHFLELGNKYTGDCIYIKAGDTDILIDAGSRGNSADDICNYINQYVTDNTLEYVIATHAHQDHIAGFVGTSKIKGIFEEYVCEVIIDFPMTEATTKVYKDYVTKRDEEVRLGAKHYTALECYNNLNGASRIVELGENIELEILYNYYYEHDASTENDYSVCLMINQADKHFLFTGDLEEHGEEKLVELNTLPKVDVLKAGHHGSYTATTNILLETVDPEIVCVCCCCGSDEYTEDVDKMFPSQAFISRVSKYTDKIYVTSIVADNDEGFTSLNGNINIISNGNGIEVLCSNNNTIFKDTVWFKENRKWE